MSARNGKDGKKPTSAAINLVAGGGAGMMEALVCHPLDTIKVRMQLSRRGRDAPRRGFVRTGVEIVRKETPLGLYKGLGAVVTGIVPKMAIRFSSFEWYKQLLHVDTSSGSGSGKGSGKGTSGNANGSKIFLAGLAAGVTEAVAVVTPMEVIKIRLQAQHHSMADPLDVPKYRNAAHALYTVVKEEGFGALYRGVALTALRQGSNQAVNFTAYTYFKDALRRAQPHLDSAQPLPTYQTTLIGLVSGAMGPLSNAPIDTIKTRLQKTPAQEGVSAWRRVSIIAADMFKQEGFHAFYKGITPRVMRVAPGQAVTFTVYEFLKDKLERSGPLSLKADQYEE
ncbi:succinate:fumarate antiporter [Niveomyces insectorum RCEF 264]|uniref:Succinate:fumarate antiporter n=1 Tax=Niveomyces insectorum RCEF 264 TaxID=1081102 RepID=A0A167NGX6_9HYPO|nr:succinate:fumarate antiporter [Niveomyces insectorum RCEF 264]